MDDQPRIEFHRLRPDHDADIQLPRYMTAHSAGMDVEAAVDEPVLLAPGAIRLIPTGFAMALPEGYEAQIRPRSGLAVRHGISLINSPGTIDADYRGEVQIALINLGSEPYWVRRRDRIAQMVVQRVVRVVARVVDRLPESGRGAGGFGHTGRA